MKGLIRTTIIMVLIIAVGVGTSILLTFQLVNRLEAARERGYETGHAEGYVAGFKGGHIAGYQEGSKIGYIKADQENRGSDETGFYFLYNPAYDEVRKILAENEMYSAREIHDYAEANGIRSAYIRCPIARKATEGMIYIYELVAFETVDKGLIIIEPWSHREVQIEVGKSYSELNGFPAQDHNDTITKITIVW